MVYKLYMHDFSINMSDKFDLDTHNITLINVN